ncbi:hypothetical protein BU17DRAFT_72202 [Hysterangium stoloniferum]|nr:hypothetical protein BU17DRAFT_72202 [Hysterangium stoloniferum]
MEHMGTGVGDEEDRRLKINIKGPLFKPKATLQIKHHKHIRAHYLILYSHRVRCVCWQYNNSGNSDLNYNRTPGALPAITTTTTVPIPAPSCPKPPAAMLFALRRALRSTAFDLTPDMRDARDVIVGWWGLVEVRVVSLLVLTSLNIRLAVKCYLGLVPDNVVVR